MIDQALDAAQTLRERKQMRVLEEPPRPLEVGLQDDRDHAAKAAHLLFREGVLRMFFEARILHRFDLRFRREPARDFPPVLAMTLHPERERLQDAQRQKTVIQYR